MVEVYLRLPSGSASIDFLILHLSPEHVLDEVGVLFRALDPKTVIMTQIDKEKNVHLGAGLWYPRAYNLLYTREG